MDNELFIYERNAIVNGICQEGKSQWQAAGNDKAKLIKLAMAQFAIPHFATFCYNGQGLSKEYILQNFGELINGKSEIKDADGVDGFTYALYIAENRILKPSADVSHLMWCDNTIVQINACRCPILYVSNHSDITLSLDGFNTIKVYLFDESKIMIEDADETCQVTIYKYSDKCKVERGKFCLSKRIKEHEKELKL